MVLFERQVDGLVLVSQHCDALKIRQLLDAGTPFVLLQWRPAHYKDDYVGNDNRAGILEATKHLADQGQRRIGFMRGPMTCSTAIEKLAALRSGVKVFNLDPNPTLIVQGSYLRGWLQGGERAAAMMSLLQSAKLNGHDPLAYLRDVLTRLPNCSNNRIEIHSTFDTHASPC